MTRRMLKRLRAQDGFTLMEMVVAIPMMTLVVAALTVTITYSAGFSGEAQRASSLQLEARSALSMLASDLRQAYTGTTTTTPVDGLAATTLSFYSPDRQTPFHLRHIQYRFVNGTLQRSVTLSMNTGPTTAWTWGVAGPWTTEVNQLASVSFAGYTGDSPPLATAVLASIRSVAVRLTARTSGSQGRNYDFQRTIEIREDAS